MLFACDNEKTQPIRMVSVPKLEFISDRTIGKDSSQSIQISLESFYVSDEITNKEYREFTDWVKNNPEQILSKTKEIIGSKTDFGKTKVWTIPVFISMSDLLPNVIDSFALYKLDKNYKNYFTDKKYDDYPVVGVSRTNATYFCDWKTNFELVTEKVGKGKSKFYITRGPETHFRLPLEMEGSTNKWGISHLIDNVSEWVISPNDTLAIYRGGSWRTNSNIKDRQWMHPDSSNGYTGFRIVRTYTPIEINKKTDK
jgi:formylglycine-generating enzyme required for sulfatase activity